MTGIYLSPQQAQIARGEILRASGDEISRYGVVQSLNNNDGSHELGKLFAAVDLGSTTDTVNVNYIKPTNFDESFIQAVEESKVDRVKLLIGEGAYIYAKNNEGKNPLEIAVEKNDSNMIAALVNFYRAEDFTEDLFVTAIGKCSGEALCTIAAKYSFRENLNLIKELVDSVNPESFDLLAQSSGDFRRALNQDSPEDVSGVTWLDYALKSLHDHPGKKPILDSLRKHFDQETIERSEVYSAPDLYINSLLSSSGYFQEGVLEIWGGFEKFVSSMNTGSKINFIGRLADEEKSSEIAQSLPKYHECTDLGLRAGVAAAEVQFLGRESLRARYGRLNNFTQHLSDDDKMAVLSVDPEKSALSDSERKILVGKLSNLESFEDGPMERAESILSSKISKGAKTEYFRDLRNREVGLSNNNLANLATRAIIIRAPELCYEFVMAIDGAKFTGDTLRLMRGAVAIEGFREALVAKTEADDSLEEFLSKSGLNRTKLGIEPVTV